MNLTQFFDLFAYGQAMIFILLLSSVCLSVKAENGYGYEVEVIPLNETSEATQPFKGVPTGGYTFLGFGAKNPPNFPGNQKALDKVRAPEMHLGLNTVPSENQGNRNVMDLVLVLDSSYSIASNGWMNLINTAKKLLDSLDISPDGTHVSIMKFSTDVETVHMFDPNATKEHLKQLLDALEFDGEWSRLDLAMKAVEHHAFSPIDGARPGNVPKAVVIFSDGKPDGPTPPEEEIDWQTEVAEPLNSLKEKHVDVFSVAAGVPDKIALAAITGSPARVFDIDSLDNLVTAIEADSLKVSPTEPATPPTLPPTTSPPPQAPTETVVTKATSSLTTSTVLGTCTAIQTVTLTTAVVTTPVTIVIATETQTSLLTATETASTLVVTATQTDTVTETVTATATQSLTSTAMDTATSIVTATATATEVVTLTTTVGVTSTTYAEATATPVPITIMGSVQGKKRNTISRVKRWYEDYLPHVVKQWMAINN